MHPDDQSTSRHSGIAIGDLVQVVRPPYCPAGPAHHGLGHIFVVGAFDRGRKHRCGYCSKLHGAELIVALDETGAFARSAWWEVRRIRRIPPLEELKRLEVRERSYPSCLKLLLES